MRRSGQGFTLIELMVVVAVIAILALLALPGYQSGVVRGQVVEAAKLAEVAKAPVAAAWTAGQPLPADNAEAGLPISELIVGNLVRAVRVEDGAVHLVFGNRAHARLQGRTLSFRPAVVPDTPVVPVAWVCGGASAPERMVLRGRDRSDLDRDLLPLNCR